SSPRSPKRSPSTRSSRCSSSRAASRAETQRLQGDEMNLVDVPQVLTQILGFLLMVWILRRYAWGPVMGMLEARREKIAGEFKEADRLKAEAVGLKARYETDMKGIEAQARQRMQEAVAEGQRVAAEIKTQAQKDAAVRLERAAD